MPAAINVLPTFFILNSRYLRSTLRAALTITFILANAAFAETPATADTKKPFMAIIFGGGDDDDDIAISTKKTKTDSVDGNTRGQLSTKNDSDLQKTDLPPRDKQREKTNADDTSRWLRFEGGAGDTD